LHDLWWLTGRCAFPETCPKYQGGCDSSCPTPEEYPALPPQEIATAWQAKRALLAEARGPRLLAYSPWAAAFAAETLAAWGIDPGRAAEISLGFPLELFRPYEKSAARRSFGLPERNFIVLLTGDPYDRRKRIDEAIEALRRLDLPDLTVVSLGVAKPGESFPLADFRRLGYIGEPERLAELYAAADLLVSASRDETLGQVFIESIACGTPALGYRVSGIAAAIRDGVTGRLLDHPSADSLAQAIRELYDRPDIRRDLGRWGRVFVENEFSEAAAYRNLFLAWRRLGLASELRLPPKISFRAEKRPLLPVRTVSAAAADELAGIEASGEIYDADLTDGIDFRRPGRPSFTKRFLGLSFPEAWGRWSDGPRVEICFRQPLPRRFRLELDAGALGENCQLPALVAVGDQRVELRIPFDVFSAEPPGTPAEGQPGALALPRQSVELSTSGQETVLAIDVPRPTIPPSAGPEVSGDARELGFALQRLRIVDLETVPARLRRIWKKFRTDATGADRRR
jgi:hypothetical protein